MSEDQALEDARERITDYRDRIQHLDESSIALLFSEARNHNWWQDRDVSAAQLREAFELARMGPTSGNTQPMRITFVRTKEAKERLNAHVNGPNQEKTMLAPVTAIIAYDNTFFTDFPKFNPIRPEMADRFSGNAEMAESFSRIQAILQGGYFIMALRAVGLDVGAMGGFNNAGVDEEFFASTPVKSIFLCNIGYGDVSGIKGARLYRYGFDEVCEIV